MTTYRPFAIYEDVVLINDTEIDNAYYAKAGTKGIVLDSCVPDYYKVRLENYGIFWVSGSKLKRI